MHSAMSRQRKVARDLPAILRIHRCRNKFLQATGQTLLRWWLKLPLIDHVWLLRQIRPQHEEAGAYDEVSRYGKSSTKCGITYHFSSVCKKTSQLNVISKKSQHTPSPTALYVADAIFDSLCNTGETTPVSNAHSLRLNHHVYNEFCKAWEKQTSDPQRFVDVTIHAVPSDT
ncbi:hypothetical protein PoB_000270100 [Plakobranchus ocellatus]|uniref:Uncharacterized protein n=1 Tax=Plakobranchus ocellatus TaxID=259542 RepID=A0AAV3Y1F7_9GAST|nr:hypothetical protein PoB_000270100 [Plakobranchus ocellatus]